MLARLLWIGAMGLVAGLATPVLADEPDSLTILVRQRPTATAPT